MTSPDLDPYDALGLLPNASPGEIRAAYRRRAAECHPDVQPPDKKAWASEQMIRLNAARDLLLNPRRRVHYHREHADGLQWRAERARWRQNAYAAPSAYTAARRVRPRRRVLWPFVFFVSMALLLLSLSLLPLLMAVVRDPSLAAQFQNMAVQQFIAGLALLGSLMLTALQWLFLTALLALFFFGLSRWWKR